MRWPKPSRLLGRPARDPDPDDQELDAVYFDTTDLRLARAGITLRRREGGSDPGWHLKLPVGPDSRDELRVPLGRARRKPPAELLALTRVHTRGAKVAPVVRLLTRRRRWILAGDDQRPLAELAEDRVTAHTMGRGTEADPLAGARGRADRARLPRTAGPDREAAAQSGCAAVRVGQQAEPRAGRPATHRRGRARRRVAALGRRGRAELPAHPCRHAPPLRPAGPPGRPGLGAQDAGVQPADAQHAAGLQAGAGPGRHPSVDRRAEVAGRGARPGPGHRGDGRPVQHAGRRAAGRSWCSARSPPPSTARSPGSRRRPGIGRWPP